MSSVDLSAEFFSPATSNSIHLVTNKNLPIARKDSKFRYYLDFELDVVNLQNNEVIRMNSEGETETGSENDSQQQTRLSCCKLPSEHIARSQSLCTIDSASDSEQNKRVSFSDIQTVGRTHNPKFYKRGVLTAKKIKNPHKIGQELDSFKQNEMRVHRDSLPNTLLHYNQMARLTDDRARKSYIIDTSNDFDHNANNTFENSHYSSSGLELGRSNSLGDLVNIAGDGPLPDPVLSDEGADDDDACDDENSDN
eukprot:Awhi_evm1s7157